MSAFPDFSLFDQNGTAIDQTHFAQGKYVLYAYPADFTPGCTTEARDFAAMNDEFKAAGYTIVGLSPDDTPKHKKFCDAEALPFDLISDPDKTLLKAIDAFGEKKNYGKTYMGVIRSTLLVEDGQITERWHNVRAKGHAARILKHVQGL